jgi:hypothetical protein
MNNNVEVREVAEMQTKQSTGYREIIKRYLLKREQMY